ncbi:MAG: twin-arginine translocase subunit TatB [Alteromonadaceae bacterium]|jgi:sec-independent protein translocase protein TatB|uniref:Sec-independent protein translocase protein TatB n=1 Tax=unclassified Methylophaga TaxID=2629249 RepID=UPI000C65E1C1|nr:MULTISPECIES: Sec-independent protein translocase protein TatB [unclassified Methylophaga]MAP28076.1 twin-arginine translocase subunit TatB [Methylophaga sp.]MBN26788.1 twin-arginine translocase subunit TatB [Alteromonadaceae bacterium]|tara:strand:+ start:2030 stop:2419 length:390 start_codon:yes stop_codon:yes gene_type:complete
MFNIAFPELLIIGVVALIVIGPDKLPAVARTAGILFGRMQRFTMNIKSEIDKELHTADLKRLESELRDHDLGLSEELRQGMQPVELVIKQNQSTNELPIDQKKSFDQVNSPIDNIVENDPKPFNSGISS